MKKVVFLVLLFMACGFAVKAQGLSIAYKDSLYGVQNKEGDWVINPIYVSIDSIECGAKKYYVLYEELGYLASEEYLWLDYEEFIYYEDLIMPKFHIADSDFFVLANQSYEDLQVIDDEGMSPHPMIFLTSDLGMDLILPNQDRHIAFGGLNFHLFDDDLLMLHGENDKHGLYDVTSDQILLEVYYDDIKTPVDLMYVEYSVQLDGDSGFIDSELPGFEQDVLVVNEGKFGIYNYEENFWTLDFVEGEFVTTLTDNLDYIIVDAEGWQQIYYQGEKLPIKAYSFVIGEDEESPMLFNSKALRVIDSDYSCSLVSWEGEVLYTSDTKMDIINERFFAENHRYDEPGIDESNESPLIIRSFDDPGVELFRGDYYGYLGEGANYYYGRYNGTEEDDRFAFVHKDDRPYIILSSGAVLGPVVDLWYDEGYLCYEHQDKSFGVVDLDANKPFDLQAKEQPSIQFDWLHHSCMIQYTNMLGEKKIHTPRGNDFYPNYSDYWELRKDNTGWRMYAESMDMTDDYEMQPLFELGYKKMETLFWDEIMLCKALKDGKWGVLNFYEEEILPFDYEDIESGMDMMENYRFKVKKDGKWGLLDMEGKSIIQNKYKSIDCFPTLPTDYLGDFYVANYSKKEYDVYDVEGNLLFPAGYNFIDAEEVFLPDTKDGKHETHYIAENKAGEKHMVILYDYKYHATFKFDSYYQNHYLVQLGMPTGKMQLQNKWGEVLSDKLYKQGAHLMGDVVVEPTEGGYVLYSLQGNRVNQMTYSKVEIIDEAFLYLERDKSGYYMHFELHKEIPENEW